MSSVEPFFVDIFKGVLCLFMIDIGMVAASKIGQSEAKLSPGLLSFSIIFPLLNAGVGALIGDAVGLQTGSVMLFSVLCASVSYIAVPAAMRVAAPNVDLSRAVTLSLAISFPFNIVFGLPLYLSLAQYLTQ